MRNPFSSYLNLVLLAVLGFLPGCGPGLFPDSRTKPRGNVKVYKEQLEKNLLTRYNNTPKWANQIGRVELIIPVAPEKTIDNSEMRVEFNQLVFDRWGERVPQLEEEYFIVTFGNGRPRLVRTDPSIKVGMREGGYSEAVPIDTGRLGTLRMPRPGTPSSPPAPPPVTNGAVEQTPAPAEPDPIPEMPVKTEDRMPSRITFDTAEDGSLQPMESLTSPDQEPDQEGLLRSMVPPSGIAGPRLKAQVRNLPSRMMEPELAPELDSP